MRIDLKKIIIPLFIGIILFIIPFGWLKPGFVDLGGDSSRLYFVEPFELAQYYYNQKNYLGATMYAFIPGYLIYFVIQKIIMNPTTLIGFSQGIQLSGGFIGMFLVVRELIFRTFINKDTKNNFVGVVAMISSLVYVGLSTKTGWITSLETQNQVFLNPLLFYILLQTFLTKKIVYILSLLLLTMIYSGNFGYSSMPQLVSFIPLSIVFIFIYIRFIIKIKFPWKYLFVLGGLYLLIHSFHLVPTLFSFFQKSNIQSSHILSRDFQKNSGLAYFDHNRQTLGKLSTEIFQPLNWNNNSLLIIVIPIIAFSGFLTKKSKIIALLGWIFAITFYLVSANITIIGVKIYRYLFNIPGFLMFRSFDEKWYFVYIFFFSLLFGISFFQICYKKSKLLILFISLVIILSILYRIFPFLTGINNSSYIYQSEKVPVAFDLDRDLLPSIQFVKALPDDGKVLTLPLTYPYFQIIYGENSGAYVGLSVVRLLSGKDDYPGFGTFGTYKNELLYSFRDNNISKLLQIFSLHNIKYVFHNTDPRVLEKFPMFPNYKYDMTIDIPSINSQIEYKNLLKQFDLTLLYKKGNFSVSNFHEEIVRPTIYIPNIIFESFDQLLQENSFRSAFLNKEICNMNDICSKEFNNIPQIEFIKNSPVDYSFKINLKGRMEPFMLILSENYNSSWKLTLNSRYYPEKHHILVNNYANGWIIEPNKLSESPIITGSIKLDFQRYFTYGIIISLSGAVVLIGLSLKALYEKYFNN